MAWNYCGDWPAAKNRASSVAQPFHRNVQQIRPAAGADIWAGELTEPAKLQYVFLELHVAPRGRRWLRLRTRVQKQSASVDSRLKEGQAARHSRKGDSSVA